MLEWRPPALTITPHSHAHTASPRPLARTHDTNTKRNRNQFPDWGSPASINSPQSPMFFTIIMIIHKHFQEAMIFRNYFFMVKSTVVQPPLLARLATVSVLFFSWRGISCPSSYSQEYRRAAAPSGPLCYCFGITRSRR